MLMIQFIRYLGLILSLSMTIGLVHAQIGVDDYVPPSFTKHERKSPSYINNCPMDLMSVPIIVDKLWNSIVIEPNINISNDNNSSLRLILFKDDPYKDNNNDGQYNEMDTTILVDTLRDSTDSLRYMFDNTSRQDTEYFIGFTTKGECWEGDYHFDIRLSNMPYVLECFIDKTCSEKEEQVFIGRIVARPQGGSTVVIKPLKLPSFGVEFHLDLGNDISRIPSSALETYIQGMPLEQFKAIQQISVLIPGVSQELTFPINR